MLEYILCKQTVTVYRREGGSVTRRVVEGCFYHHEARTDGERFVRKFLLICPGAVEIRPGDRVLEGVGPEDVVWEEFLPVNVPGLGEAAYAAPWYWDGHIDHWEAGRK